MQINSICKLHNPLVQHNCSYTSCRQQTSDDCIAKHEVSCTTLAHMPPMKETLKQQSLRHETCLASSGSGIGFIFTAIIGVCSADHGSFRPGDSGMLETMTPASLHPTITKYAGRLEDAVACCFVSANPGAGLRPRIHAGPATHAHPGNHANTPKGLCLRSAMCFTGD